MKEDLFGNIMYDGKMINVDTEDIEKLSKISEELKEKNKKSIKFFIKSLDKVNKKI